MFDLVAIGGIAVDLYFSGDSLTKDDKRFHLAIGGKYFVDSHHQFFGGGAVNVAVGASYYGLKTAIIGKIGKNQFYDDLINFLQKKHINYEYCQIEKSYQNLSIVLLTKSGERTVINYQNPHQHLEKSQKNRLNKTNFPQCKFLYMGNLPDTNLKEKIEIAAYYRKQNSQIVLNLGIHDCRLQLSSLYPLLSLMSVLIINNYEFSELVKAPIEDIHFNEDVISWYVPKLRDKLIIITQGKKGSYAYLNGRIYYQKAFHVDKIVDTNGVGDAFIAGFISAYIENKNIENSLLNAANFASKALKKIGAN